MRLIILLFFLISSFISAQEEKKRNGLKNLLKQAEKLAKDLGLDDKKKETKDFFFSSRDIGKTSFSTADRIAIKDVIDAYGFYLSLIHI